jgi:hypothetical protein
VVVQFKNTTDDVKTGKNLPPPLPRDAKTEFDPGLESFGLFVSNDGLADSLVYSEPARVKVPEQAAAEQPYKLMIYPYKDKATGKLVPNSYLLGGEYSTNDDFRTSSVGWTTSSSSRPDRAITRL